MAITKRKRKGKVFYQAEVYVSGERVATECFDTAAAANDWHDRTKRRYEQGYGRYGEMTLTEVIESYRADELGSKAGPTRRRRKSRFALIEKSPIACVRMRDFHGQTIDLFLDWLLRHPVAETPVRTSFLEELKALRLVLGHFREAFDPQFVVPMTRRHRRRALYKGPIRKKPKDFFMPVDHARAWLACLERQRNPLFHRLATVQVILGTRVGETAALCEDAIDWEQGTITIKRTMEWADDSCSKVRRIMERVKTEESRRMLPMPPEVEEILRAALREQPAVLHRTKQGATRVVFHMPDGGLLHYETIRQSYNRAFRDAALPWTASHICRDTNGTLGLKGGSLEQVRVNHGHSSVVETEGYAKVHAMIENRVPIRVAGMLFGEEEKSSRTKSRTDAEGGS